MIDIEKSTAGRSPVEEPPSSPEEAPRNPRSKTRKILRIICWSLCAIILLLVAAVAGISLWLTPPRLSSLINKQGSELLGGEIRVVNADYSLFSSFPRLKVEFDSLSISAPAFSDLPDSVRRRLPADPERLVTAGKSSATLDVLPLLKGKISIGNIRLGPSDMSVVQISDSLDNYSFLSHGKSKPLPDITLCGEVSAESIRASYVSLPMATRASASIDSIRIIPEEMAGSYQMHLSGKANATMGNKEMLRDFPFAIAGPVTLRQNPFGLNTGGLQLNIGEAPGTLSLDADLENQIRLNTLKIGMGPFDVFRTLGYIPAAAFNLPDGMEGHPLLKFNASLTEPFLATDTLLPSGELDFEIPDGTITYPDADGKLLSVEHSNLRGSLSIDGRHPERSRVEIPEVRFAGEGVDLALFLAASDLLGNPQIETRINGHTDLGYLNTPVADILRRMAPEGIATLSTALRFGVEDIKSLRLDRITASGNAGIKDFSLTGIIPGMRIGARTLNLSFADDTSSLSADSLGNSLLNLNFSGRNLRFNYRGITGSADSLSINSHEAVAGITGSNPGKSLNSIPVALTMAAKGINFSDPADSLKGKIGDFSAQGTVRHDFSRGIADILTGRLRTAAIALTSGKARMNIDDIRSEVKGARLSRPRHLEDYRVPAKWTADRQTLAIANHYPEYLQVKIPAAARQFLSLWDGAAEILLTGGNLTAPIFPVNTRIEKISLAATTDSVELRDFYLRTVDTGLRLRGGVSNIRQFLTSRTPAPLEMNLTATMDTIMLDHLAAAYERGQVLTKGPDAAKMHPKSFYATPRDSITILLPRNIRARIHASAKESEYLGLDLYNYLIEASMADGRLDVEHINVDSGFGDGAFALSYDTSDANNLAFGLKADLDSVNIVNFFTNFHTLMLMMPAVRSLAGIVGIHTDVTVGLFPDMYLNFPSITGKLDFSTRDLMIHQSPEMHKYMRYFLIPDSTLNLTGLDVKATLHDNLYEIYPTQFDLGRYRLGIAGIGSYNGACYYHFGVFRSPFHLPFGVNIKGSLKHPKIRFGSAHWHDSNAREVTDNLSDTLRVNVIGEAKYIIRDMIHKAAEADSLPASAFTFQ